MPATALRVLGDDRLFRLAAAGDSRAFELLYERHYQAIYRYCRSIVGNPDDAADALQSTMASALRAIVGEQREIPVRPWLFRIAHNESVSLLRKRRPHSTIDDALDIEAPAHDPAIKQRLADLVADLHELPDAQRGALVMHELSGLPYREIGSALEVTEAHARQLVYEARTALHDLAEGRAMECDHVRRTISDGDRRVLRGRRIRSHLRTCSGCASFDQVLRTRRRDLAAIAPPLPAAAAAGLLHKILGGAGSGGTGAAASSSGGVGSMLGAKALAVSGASKFAAVVAITAAAGVGAVEVARTTGHSASQSSAGAQAAPRASAASQRNALVGPAVMTMPVSRLGTSGGRQNGANSQAHHGTAGNGNTAHPIHPAHPFHPTHPNHPSNSAHPSHPVKPVHPSHPSQPSHPSHPVTPVGGKNNSSGAPASQPTHPTKPVRVPVVNTPVTPQAVTTPTPTAGGNGQSAVKGNGNAKSVLDLIP